MAEDYSNFLWAAFTRTNPSHDIHGIHAFVEHKHWGCKGSLIMDARIKPHHAPELVMDKKVELAVERFFEKGASLEGY
jgi:4-hydroxy-3-polyprenylbenzoate decarboxylase